MLPQHRVQRLACIYYLSYVSASGETRLSTAAAGTDATTVTDGAHVTTVTITSPGSRIKARITSIKIWRTKVGAAIPYLVTTLTPAVWTPYTDSSVDASNTTIYAYPSSIAVSASALNLPLYSTGTAATDTSLTPATQTWTAAKALLVTNKASGNTSILSSQYGVFIVSGGAGGIILPPGSSSLVGCILTIMKSGTGAITLIAYESSGEAISASGVYVPTVTYTSALSSLATLVGPPVTVASGTVATTAATTYALVPLAGSAGVSISTFQAMVVANSCARVLLQSYSNGVALWVLV